MSCAEFKSCPWVSADVAEDAYLKMGKVVIVTFSYTFIHAVLYMICKGWNTTNQNVDRNRATNLTLVMACMYLMYSAYYLSEGVHSMEALIASLLMICYMILGVTNVVSTQT